MISVTMGENSPNKSRNGATFVPLSNPFPDVCFQSWLRNHFGVIEITVSRVSNHVSNFPDLPTCKSPHRQEVSHGNRLEAGME